ncbi:MAG: ImmA/IrrE family metallo-endopeptidase [Planctomycetaceae bacterium]
MIDDWNSLLDCMARELLESAAVDGPPVDPFRIADRRGIRVATDARQQVRGRQKTLNGRPVVFLKPDDRPERVQWALAHELGEIHAWRAADRAGIADTLSTGMREQIANQLASRILLPGHWFFPDAARCDDDVLELKTQYATASHSLIALRLLDRDLPAVVSIFDQGRLTYRKSNRASFSADPIRAEEEDEVRRAMQSNRLPSTRSVSGRRIRSWPIDEPGRQRDIVVMTLTATDDAFDDADWPQDSAT